MDSLLEIFCQKYLHNFIAFLLKIPEVGPARMYINHIKITLICNYLTYFCLFFSSFGIKWVVTHELKLYIIYYIIY